VLFITAVIRTAKINHTCLFSLLAEQLKKIPQRGCSMYKCLNLGNIGVKLAWEECLPLAKASGFEGFDVPVDPKFPASYYQDLLGQYNLKPGGMGLPFHPADEAGKVAAGLAGLPAICTRAQEIGQTRFYIWIMPFSDTLERKENFQLHAERLGKAAKIMQDYGCSLGLEFIGPKTLRIGHRYGFLRTMDEMLDLCAAAGENVGLLLDAYHWWTSLGVIDDLLRLENRQIVYVHINDGQPGLAVDEQLDLVRCLPGETGKVDIAGFFAALRKIQYDGPVVAEPFEKKLYDLSPAEAIRVVAAAVDKVWQL
jgi:sugar phosphate isomerase/epimerase